MGSSSKLTELALFEHRVPDLRNLDPLVPRLQLVALFAGVPEKPEWPKKWGTLSPTQQRAYYHALVANCVGLPTSPFAVTTTAALTSIKELNT